MNVVEWKSGFPAGVRAGWRLVWRTIAGRPFAFRPWPAPRMPSVSEHLQSYGGPSMSRSMFDRAEADWYRMLDQRKRLFHRYVYGWWIGCVLAWSILIGGIILGGMIVVNLCE